MTTAADFVPEINGSGRGFAWIQGRGLRIYSCYNSRNDTNENFDTFLDDIHQSARECDDLTHVLICGDFNSWLQEWSSAHNDQRGQQLSDLATSLNLSTENIGTTATYRRINAESVIDVTFSRIVAPATIRGWRVLEDVESTSDHRYVEFTLDPTSDEGKSEDNRSRGWSYCQLDSTTLATHLANTAQPVVNDATTVSQAADQLIEYLEAACNSCMPLRVPRRASRREAHWWLKDLAAFRQSTIELRRALQRSARRHDLQDLQDAHRAAYSAKRKDLRNAIRAAQAKSWAELCGDLDDDPWGLPYRVVTKKINRKRSGIEARGREDSIVNHLFSDSPATEWSLEPRLTDDAIDLITPRFTIEELRKAYVRLPAGKATGLDGIPNEVLLRVSKTATLVFLNTFNRPLCMLNSTAKLFERLLLIKLNQHLDSTGQRSEIQYGFRHGRSTEDAIERVIAAARGAATGATQHRDLCIVVSLDVRNAFNTAPWPRIDTALRGREVPPYLNQMIRSYLEDRTLLVGEAQTVRRTTCEVPQGSVLEPSLWKIFYDDLLDTDIPPGVQLVAFADDIAVIGTSRTGPSAAELINLALETVNNWMRDNSLTIALQKSKAVVLIRKYKYDNPLLYVDGHVIPVKPAIRYLRVELDTRLSFMTHIATVSRKAIESAKAIGRLMPNVGGPAQANGHYWDWSPTASYCTRHRPGRQSAPRQQETATRWPFAP
ncbi:hypothetical protein QTP88_018404 [Uroleucon formosanum]